MNSLVGITGPTELAATLQQFNDAVISAVASVVPVYFYALDDEVLRY
jgi:hypothetical protein